MTYDLAIRGGTIVDGLRTPRFHADVGIVDGRIVRVGRLTGSAKREINADGLVVTPGFIDAHTHMDAQIFWDPLGTCSSWHGVTTVVMGNCGFSLAPAGIEQRPLVVRNLERAEDISGAAMEAGIEWSWRDYASYLDTLDRLPKGINYAAYVGHSALRTWVMGERAFDDRANADDVADMAEELRRGLAAGAIGFSTSRSEEHLTADGRPVASTVADWDEVSYLVRAMGETGAGLFELAHEAAIRSEDADERHSYHARLRDLAVGSRVPFTFGLFDRGDEAAEWQEELRLLDETAALGGLMHAQATTRDISVLYSFETALPYDNLPAWRQMRTKSLHEQEALLHDPAVRALLVAAAESPEGYSTIGEKAPDYTRIRALQKTTGQGPTIDELARQQRRAPTEIVIDSALEVDLKRFFTKAMVNVDRGPVEEILRHPRSIMTFSDSGAHVSQIMDSSIQTHLLAEWVRERQAFTLEEAVNMMTLRPALAWGFRDRGCVREGMQADLNVLDPDTVQPELPRLVHDLPTGARRLVQKTAGLIWTIVGGEVLFESGEHSGALPGRLLRGPLAN